MSDHDIRLPELVRKDLREYADERGMTYSEALYDIMPVPRDENVFERGAPTTVTVDDDAHHLVDALTGEGMDMGDTIALCLKEAKEDTNYD